MSADPVIISGIKPSRLIPLEPSVSEIHLGMDFGAGDSCTQFHQIQLVKPSKPGGEAELDILKLRVGAVMPMSSVPELKIETAGQNPQAAEGLSDATKRILDAYAEACSRWFSAMRACIRRDRVRQGLFREEHGLPNSARIPYQKQPLTAAEHAIAAMSEATIRCLFGDTVADYARDKFSHAIETGDMRAFKIRLLVIKARDFLLKEKSPIHPEFVKGMEQCIDKAEKLAGCIPDPSPRRMSKAEQERKRKREEDEKRQKELQPELPLEWPGQSSDGPIHQDIEHHASTSSTDATSSCGSVSEAKFGTSSKEEESSGKTPVSEDRQDIDNVTVTVSISRNGAKKGNGSGKSRRKTNGKSAKSGKHGRSGIVRKAREYSTVEQILDDIEDGKIVPYESSDEICEDVKAGLITPVEALMFTSALDRYCPQDGEDFGDQDRGDLERETVGVDDDEDEDDVEEDRDVGGGTSFSYNPNGFAGADRFGGDREDWGSDDQW